jgi:type IV secretion system protein VirB10
MTNLDPDRPGGDPRPPPGDDAPSVDSLGRLRPSVGGASSGAQVWLIGGGAAALGLTAFLWLNSHRAQAPADLASTQGAAKPAAATAPPAPPPPEVAAMEAASRAVAVAPPPPPPQPAPTPAPAPMFMPSSAPMPVLRAPTPPPSRAPVLVVDLDDGAGGAIGGATGPAGAAGPSPPRGVPGAPGSAAVSGSLNSDEQFAARVEGQEPARSRATILRGKSLVVAQGATIPGVLETALDSDLPGFARAVVSRDVRSFDGSTVLIPRGSRVIGEYRSAATQGQSRAFVIWSRVLRPDGVSIQIGSPATDPLGRAGLSGSVDRHFLEEFSGAILLSVINIGAAALTSAPSTTVVVGSSGATSSLGSTLSALVPTAIPPTIKVAQGTPIRIFVARDLDFSPVQGREP